MLCELLGATNDKRKYVYLSDGGHFENLGLYELVKRRCRYIIACDASEDRLTRSSALGNAIEKCRTDFGVGIEIDVEPLTRRRTGRSQWRGVVGKIRYDKVDRGASPGTLLYIKSSLTGATRKKTEPRA